jgi:hypothetical protein
MRHIKGSCMMICRNGSTRVLPDIARLAKPAEVISAKPLCHYEECSDEAILLK